MKALMLRRADGPESAALEKIERTAPAAGEVLVRLRAASLNHRELWISRGQYPGMSLPTVLGADGAGVIDAVGEGVDSSLVGKEIVLYPGLDWGDSEAFPGPEFGLLGMPGPGTIAESVCVPVGSAFAKPAHLSFTQAAALPVAALTAYRALMVKGQLKAGEKVLITGIGGGVATFGLLFAKAAGASVYVTSGTNETLEKARTHGAVDGFNYREEGWGKNFRKAVGGGVDLVLDGAPSASFTSYGRAISMGARVLVYGSTGGYAFEVNAPELFLRHATVIGTAMGSVEDFRAMLDFVSEHRLEPVIDRVFDFDQAASALHYLEHGHSFGKIVIDLSA